MTAELASNRASLQRELKRLEQIATGDRVIVFVNDRLEITIVDTRLVDDPDNLEALASDAKKRGSTGFFLALRRGSSLGQNDREDLERLTALFDHHDLARIAILRWN